MTAMADDRKSAKAVTDQSEYEGLLQPLSGLLDR